MIATLDAAGLIQCVVLAVATVALVAACIVGGGGKREHLSGREVLLRDGADMGKAKDL